jgi:iron-sulfur cluster repair protein YtfE (RIC family)
MLVTLGKPRMPDDLVELLMACHERIHRFLDMARRLAEARGAAPAELQTTAGQVRRYFANALPQHIADEDLVIVPHLVGRTAALDAALGAMSADHVDHAQAVSRLVVSAAGVEDDPRLAATTRHELAAATEALRALLIPHLALEEDLIFPVLRELPAGEQHVVRATMQERRVRALSVGGGPV